MVAARSDGSADLWTDDPARVLDVSGDALLLAKQEGSQAVVVEERGATDGRVRWRQRFTGQHVEGLLGPHVAVLFVWLTVAVDEMQLLLRMKNTLFAESILEPTARPWSVNLGSELAFEARTRDSRISLLSKGSISVWGPLG